MHVTAPLAPAPVPRRVLTGDAAHDELRRRMRGPQRHRLLHGYPLAAAMPRLAPGDEAELRYQTPVARGLLVGVLPHPFCNPTVPGCGFCTFPHERFETPAAVATASAVLRELGMRLAREPGLRGQRVAALYVGGGTANLTPAGPFRDLCRGLRDAFDLSAAEVTLEGVPAYFLIRRPLLFDTLREELPARRLRISMGVQTFNERRLREMGRAAFGTSETFAEVVRQAQNRGLSVSADLLFDLPHQSRGEMLDDVRLAIDLGLEHLGLYHLVLFRGLGTAWSRDETQLAGLPGNDTAAENWIALRELLLANGYVQTTLTNFERADRAGSPERFVYEELSFRPDRSEMLGLGPGGISYSAGPTYRTAWKSLNPVAAADYRSMVDRGTWRPERVFRYEADDLRVFHVTRRIAALVIDCRQYRRLFGTDVTADFAAEIGAARSEGLLEMAVDAFRLTPRGMFFADSVAATFARRRLPYSAARSADSNPSDEFVNDNGRGHM